MSFSIPASTHQAVSQNLVNLSLLTLCCNTESRYSPEQMRTHPLCMQPDSSAMSLYLHIHRHLQRTGKAQHYCYYLFKGKKNSNTQDWHFHWISMLLCLIFVSQRLHHSHRQLLQTGENTSVALLATSTQEKPNSQGLCMLQKSVSQISNPPSSTYKFSPNFWFYQHLPLNLS